MTVTIKIYTLIVSTVLCDSLFQSDDKIFCLLPANKLTIFL